MPSAELKNLNDQSPQATKGARGFVIGLMIFELVSAPLFVTNYTPCPNLPEKVIRPGIPAIIQGLLFVTALYLFWRVRKDVNKNTASSVAVLVILLGLIELGLVFVHFFNFCVGFM